MNDDVGRDPGGANAAALRRARRDLLAEVEATAKEVRKAIGRLRSALEAAGFALPPSPADDDQRLWPEAGAQPPRGGRPRFDDIAAYRRMAELLEAGEAKSIRHAARLAEAELEAEADRSGVKGPDRPAREAGSVAKRLERGYRDTMDLLNPRFLAAHLPVPFEQQVVRYRAALAAAGLSFRDGHMPWAAEDAAADLIFASL